MIGNFDGVHRGHQALLTTAARAAKREGLRCTVLTFTPHPLVALGKVAPPMLTTPSRKRRLVEEVARALSNEGAELGLVEQRFDLAFAAQSPRAFAEWLARELEAKVVLVGQNFRFGQRREGTFERLVELGRELGFEARAEPLVSDALGTISSTRVRALITEGDMPGAEALLGRPHSISGEVVTGKQLGRTIGFPTANLGGVAEMLPPFGVYAVLVDRVVPGARDVPLGWGAMSVGVNPTTDATTHTKVEIFISDRVSDGQAEPGFSEDLYGATLRAHVVARLREEQKFDSLEALVAQIERDVETSRTILSVRAAPRSFRLSLS